jgi:hypothetical protein
METPVIVAIIAATVAGIGWVVNHVLTTARDRANQQLTATLNYTERQLEDFMDLLHSSCLKVGGLGMICWISLAEVMYLEKERAFRRRSWRRGCSGLTMTSFLVTRESRS